MRKVMLITCILLCFTGFGQKHNIKEGLQHLIEQSQTDFNGLKNGIKEIVNQPDSFGSNYTIFFSRYTFPNSNYSEIVFYANDSLKGIYLAELDSVKSEDANKEMNQWRKKIAKALDGSFKEEYFQEKWGSSMGLKGYQFKNASCHILIITTYGHLSFQSIYLRVWRAE